MGPDAQPTELPVVHLVEFPVVNPIKHAESPDALLEPRVGSCVFLDSQPAVLLGAPDGDLVGKLAAQTVDLPDEVLRRQFLSEASQLLSVMKAANMPAVSDDISQCQYTVDCLIAATSQVDLVSSWGKFLAMVDDIRTRDYLRDSCSYVCVAAAIVLCSMPKVGINLYQCCSRLFPIIIS